MKYKRVKSAIRNVAHSFVSLTNYVDDEYIIDILPALLRDIPGNVLTIQLPSGTMWPDWEYPVPLRTSVFDTAASFADQLRREGVDPDKVVESCLVLSLAPGLRCEARAVDDRGTIHSVFVQ